MGLVVPDFEGFRADVVTVDACEDALLESL
jgi:hypothetical protein